YVYFFFSSRRRHTRFSRDWSSDVCSSDLTRTMIVGLGQNAGPWTASTTTTTLTSTSQTFTYEFNISYGNGVGDRVLFDMGAATRSEERRVGKGCRSVRV